MRCHEVIGMPDISLSQKLITNKKRNFTMTKVNIVLDKYLTQKEGEDEEKTEAARSIKLLLKKLDLKAEKMPENNLDMFSRLLTSLKGAPLTVAEIRLAKEIISY
jgi:hypothetical protein